MQLAFVGGNVSPGGSYGDRVVRIAAKAGSYLGRVGAGLGRDADDAVFRRSYRPGMAWRRRHWLSRSNNSAGLSSPSRRAWLSRISASCAVT
ncbi:hypothetical protein ACVW0A_001305 [Pseudomonas sp. TE3610]